MEAFFGVVIIIVLILVCFGPIIGRLLGPWLQKWAMGKWEDNLRRMAGMPTRKEEKKARKKAAKQGNRTAGSHYGRTNAYETGTARSTQPGPANFMREFAEDVEFTEIREFSSDIKIGSHDEPDRRDTKKKYKEESQIEDAVYEEIRK